MKKAESRFLLFVLIFLLFAFRSSPFAFAAEDVKHPNVAGTFYPEDKVELSQMITRLLDDVRDGVVLEGTPKVLISPHAGYIYSGPVAAAGFRPLRGLGVDTVVILALSHHDPFHGAAVYPDGSFRTPLGDVPVDADFAGRLIEASGGFVFSGPGYFAKEHSLETQIPFLQVALKPGFKIVPIVMGDARFEECDLLARALARVAESGNVLVVASTDLSHYKPYDEALALDAASVRYMRDMDAAGLWGAVAHTGWNVCGVRPASTALLYAKYISADKAVLARYANSGDTAGDKTRVVGYVSLLITKSDAQTKGARPMLNIEEKKRLLQVARETVSLAAAGKKIPVFADTSPGCNLKRGVFVTLRQDGDLRGCIGLFTSDDPLVLSVARMAAEAATRDVRFRPVSAEEVSGISIEISVLTQPEEIKDWHQIRLGVDGVIVRSGSSSGVFLPQVATETGWDLETFLGELCAQKAGLGRECYRLPRTKLLTFQAEIFSDEDFR